MPDQKAARAARLRAVAAFVPPGRTVADIGTDHGQLAILLVASGKSPSVIATDLRPGPLEAARANVVRHGLLDRIELRLGDGLSPLRPGEVDVVVVAGLGAERIVAMLKAAGEKRATYPLWVFQPQTPARPLRAFGYGAGMELWAEDVVRAGGRSYEIVAFRRGDGRAPYAGLPVPPEVAFWLGPHLLRRPTEAFCAHWRRELARWERLAAALRSAPSAAGRVKGESLAARIARLQAALRVCGGIDAVFGP
ncbi:class I SAM-dependent methyltransferase [Hydrogenibacillus schlegelii]|uniref:Putative tRNA-m1A22 methylase n=1 Tax=Hydrogenibacillus schlegelii TaxID=1484 RepID=A0A132MFZ6_HYDSH|nr:class I SAM-dependent methyltransferase [Hydrogenibacillus schlegelii]KWW96764.1 hypothetical protein TR75_12370 [Hydrogenibacillus schlegelii]OAR05412.1 hypothetical protein SA87_10955 [Hydrogenibacillus schlegelii]PTQ54383.1 MAG: putative tRNA-m1A22 methylase [Hydrogenibacillus schlegelii]